MVCRGIIAVCSEIRKEHINSLWGQNVEFFNVIPGRTQSDRQEIMGQVTKTLDVTMQFGSFSKESDL